MKQFTATIFDGENNESFERGVKANNKYDALMSITKWCENCNSNFSMALEVVEIVED